MVGDSRAVIIQEASRPLGSRLNAAVILKLSILIYDAYTRCATELLVHVFGRPSKHLVEQSTIVLMILSEASQRPAHTSQLITSHIPTYLHESISSHIYLDYIKSFLLGLLVAVVPPTGWKVW